MTKTELKKIERLHASLLKTLEVRTGLTKELEKSIASAMGEDVFLQESQTDGMCVMFGQPRKSENFPTGMKLDKVITVLREKDQFSIEEDWNPVY